MSTVERRARRPPCRAPPVHPGRTGRRSGRRPSGSKPMIVPSGSAVTPLLRCSTLVTGTETTSHPSGARCARSCAMPSSLVRRVRPTYTVRPTLRTSPPSRVPGAVIWRWGMPAASSVSRAVSISPRREVRAGASDHGAITEHDHRILDETPSACSSAGRDVDDVPPASGDTRPRSAPTGSRARSASTGTRSTWVSSPSARRGDGGRTRRRGILSAYPRPIGCQTVPG